MSERGGPSDPVFWGDTDGTEALGCYRALVNAIDDGIYQLDADGRFVAVNDGLVELTGYAREELLGEHVSLLLDDDSSAPEQFLTNPTDQSEQLDLPVQTAAGNQIRCEVRVPLLEADGTMQRAIGIVKEITGRRRAEQPRGKSDQRCNRKSTTEYGRRLRKTKTRLEVAESAGSVSTWVWDIQENVVTASEHLAESYEMDPEEVAAGVPVEEFFASVHEGDQERVWKRLDEAVEETGGFEAEYRITNADGDTRWVVSRGEVECDGNSEAVRMIGATADVTERKEAAAELKKMTAETEEQIRLYETIISSTPDLVYVFDLDYRFTFVNEAVLEMWDRTREESIGKSLREIGYEPWHAEMHEREIDEVVETNEPIRGEVAFPHAERGRRIYEYIFAPVIDDDGEVEAVAGTTRDVTERKQAEEELQKSKERFRALVDASSDVVYRMSADWNEMHELKGKEILADTDEPTSDWLDKYIHPDEKPRVMEAIDEAIQSKSIFELEHRVERDDGSTGWTFSRAVPMLDENDEIEEWIGMASDITERKQRERALEESERRYRTLTENFPNGAVGVYDHDLQYTLTEGSVLGETLPSADRVEGNRMPELFPEKTVEDLEPVFRAAVEKGETGKTTTEFGGRSWRVWAAPLRDADGDIFAGLSFAQDITEDKQREQRLEELIEKLEESNERLEQFAYAASHDLQEPLRMVSSYLQLIERRYADTFDEEGQEFLEFAVDGADRMREMIEGLLEYSRVETRGEPFEPVDLDAVFADVRQDLAVKIEETDAEVSDKDLPQVYGDGGQLRQVFQNLLDNAIEYSGDEPPRIHISAEQAGDRWEISVRDEGVGIDPADADRVFEVFQRLHSRDDHAGTGIGLALCERIVERHGGDIWIDSAPGEGATFSFTLPVADAADE